MRKDRDANRENWRVFCALELPQQTRRRLLFHIDQLRGLMPDARASWSRESNLHLTLKFLGETAPQLVGKFDSAIARTVSVTPTFQILVNGSGVFPRPRDPRVLWVGVADPSGLLAKLHAQLEAESEQEGFVREARPFHPHLTLARIRGQQGARELARAHQDLQFVAEEINVSEVVLIRSELSSAGSRYTTISKHALQH
jgi:RNA 2',3'-cyclic 3'-phosphodiesterase